MDESAFLTALDEGDDDTLPVYADWLEEQGDTARAAFLRAQEITRRLTYRRKGFLENVREAIALGSSLPWEWLMRVSRPSLPGTVWAGNDSGGSYYVWRFLEGGRINYSSPSGDWDRATWRQVGPLVVIETNFHYATYEGVVAGKLLRGWAANVVRADWRWDVRLMSERSARSRAPYRSRWRPPRRPRPSGGRTPQSTPPAPPSPPSGA